MKNNSKTNPTKTKRSSSADLKRASSPLLSPVKEEFPAFQFPEGHSTPEFSDIQQSFITDLLEKQARQYERQNEDNNGYHERQMDRMMDQISAMNDRIEHGLTPQSPQQPMVTIQERILMETPKVQRPHDIAYHDLMTSSSQQGVPQLQPTHRQQHHTLWKSPWKNFSRLWEPFSPIPKRMTTQQNSPNSTVGMPNGPSGTSS
jgi:hypothetical protein